MTLEQIQELLKLKTENPKLEIIYMVDNYVCQGYDSYYWQAHIEKIVKGIYYLDGDKVYTDIDDLRDYLYDVLEADGDEDEDNGISFKKIVEEQIKSLSIEEAIIIYLEE